MKKNILVTGGAGFIGSNFILLFLEKNKDINLINLDSLTYASNIDHLNAINNSTQYNFIKGSINDKALVNKIFQDYEISGVINFAAETHVDNSINNPEIFVQTNIMGVYNLISIAYKHWMLKPFVYRKKFNNSRFLQVSTDEVYGSIKKGKFDEFSPYFPNSPYSASKASADMLVRSFNITYGLNTTISISSNNYGINQNKEKFIPKIIDCMINSKEIPVYGNGQNIRNWIDVKDNCSAIYNIFFNGKSGEKYNIASDNEFKNIDLINIVYDVLNKYMKVSKKIKFIDDRFGHDFRYGVDANKIKKELGWSCQNSFRKNLEDYIKKYLKTNNYE